MKVILRLLLNLLFAVKIIGPERLFRDEATIIMPNHVSFLDAILLYAYLPVDACYVINTHMAGRVPFILKFVDHIIIDPLNPYSLKKIIAAVRSGRSVVLFPEGRISVTGGLMKVYSGIGLIALRTGAAICPLAFCGPERSKYARIRKKRRSVWFPNVQLYVGEARRLQIASGDDFRRQKKQISEQILVLLQETLFAARQATEKSDNLFDKLLEAAKIHGTSTLAAEDLNGSVTLRKLLLAAYTLGGKFSRELGAAPRVGVLLPNSIAHLATLFALSRLGKTTAILNFTAGTESCRDCSETAGLEQIITSRQFIEKANLGNLAAALSEKHTLLYLEDLKARIGPLDKLSAFLQFCRKKKSAQAADLILFTSGSESKPKGVVLPHRQILANLNQLSCVVDYTPQDRLLNALPMFHSFGLTAGTLLPVLNGLCVYLYPSPLHYKVIPEISYDRNITVLLGTPTFLHGYGRSAHPYDFFSLRYVLAGGEKLKDETRFLWYEKFGLRILEGYGTTETGPVLSLNTPLFNKPGTVGRFLPGIEHRLDAVPGIENGGNLLVKGPNVMSGYLLHDKGFVPAPAWYDCGDVVAIDRDGFISIKSRLKRFAKISGEMVSLDAVEKTAAQCFGNELFAAINLPDKRKGEKILLYTPDKQANKQKLREWMQQNGQSMLALPSEMILIDALPLLGSGKTDYVRLKERAAKEASADA